MSYRITLENAELYKKLEYEKKELEKKLEAIKADFIAQLQAEGIDEKPVAKGKIIVSYKNSPQNRFNQKLFEKDYPELLQEYKVPTDRWSFSVK